MAFELLTPGAAWWQAQGLSHILLTPGQNAALHSGRAEAAAPVSSRSHVSEASPTRSFRAPSQPDPKINIEPPKYTAGAQVWKPLSIELWPAIWQERFRQTKRGKIAWTYWKLGDDLLSAKKNDNDAEALERKARSQFIRRLIMDLGHPAGTHTFWPVYLDTGSGGTAEPDLFWSGLTALGCRGVIIMGSRAARPLLNRPGLRPLSQIREKGQVVWILRDIEGFPANEYGRMLAFLRQGLAAIVRR